jgi:hypothetical protein
LIYLSGQLTGSRLDKAIWNNWNGSRSRFTERKKHIGVLAGSVLHEDLRVAGMAIKNMPTVRKNEIIERIQNLCSWKLYIEVDQKATKLVIYISVLPD